MSKNQKPDDDEKSERLSTDNFDVNGAAGGSQSVLQSHFVLSCISVKAAVDLQVTGSVLLPVEHKQPGQILYVLLVPCWGPVQQE